MFYIVYICKEKSMKAEEARERLIEIRDRYKKDCDISGSIRPFIRKDVRQYLQKKLGIKGQDVNKEMDLFN